MCFLLCTACGLLSDWVIFKTDLTPGSQIQSLVLEEDLVAVVLWTPGISQLWIVRNECLESG